jgi:hypothetical protein
MEVMGEGGGHSSLLLLVDMSMVTYQLAVDRVKIDRRVEEKKGMK